MSKIRIAIDAMGGDHGPSVVVPATVDALMAHPNLEVILVGHQEVLAPYCEKHAKHVLDRLTVHHASEHVEMDESPASALRFKKDSSMRVAINLVKEGKAQACVSAGNTGALMATARFVLKTLPGIDRPAIVYSIPTIKQGGQTLGHLRMLDLGANVDCTGEHLFQFAVMGSVLAQDVDGLQKPRIGLLNIGSEEIKGTEAVKQAAALLSHSNLHYTGFVEGTDIFQDKCDVVVCDGFVGNVALKSSEGVSTVMMNIIKTEFSKNIWTKLAALITRPVLKNVIKRVDPKRYNGATLLGLHGIVIKSHGNANQASFKVAIEEAMGEVQHNVPERIHHAVAKHLSERKSA